MSEGEGGVPRGKVIAWRPPAGSYDEAFRRALTAALEQQRALARERDEAGPFARRLAGQPPRRRELAVRNRLRSWWAAQALVDEAWGRVAGDPADAVHLTALALEIAGSLDPAAERLPLVADLAARAERVRAAALRRLGDLSRAGGALRRAWHHLRRGSGDPRERSLHLLARGALLAAQGRRRRSAALLMTAARGLRQLGERHLEGCALAELGLLLAAAPASGDRARAEGALARALRSLDPALTPELVDQVRESLAALRREQGVPPLRAAVAVC